MKHSRKLPQGFLHFVLPVCLLLAAAVPKAHAATATWTNYVTTLSDYWTNSVNWNAATYPGQDGNNQNAFLTNSVAVAYTNILNHTFDQRIGTLAISNTLGEAWLVVTSATLTNTTFALNSGGRLQIDSGAVVTGITTFTWLGTNGAIYLNNGGKLFTATGVTIGNGISNVQATVSSLSPASQAGVWNFLNQTLTVGSGASTGTVLNVNGGILTNLGVVTIGSGTGSAFNRMTVTNATLFSTGLTVGSNSSNNQLSVLSGVTWNMLGNAGTIGGIGAAATGNVLTINGGTVTNVSALYVGTGGARQNSLVVTNGGKLFVNTDIFIGNNGLNHSNSVTLGGLGASVTVSTRTVRVGDGNGASYNTLTVTNAIGFGNLSLSDGSLVGSNNTVTILANTFWNSGSIAVGNQAGSVSNSFVINGGVVSNTASSARRVGNGLGSFGNSLTVSNGGQLYWGSGGQGLTIGDGARANSNAYNVGGLGALSTVSNTTITVGLSGGYGNTLTVTNANFWGTVTIGQQGSSNNSVSVLEGATWNMLGGGFNIGNGTGPNVNNQMTVNGGTVTNAGSVRLATGGLGFGNSLTISNGGKFFSFSALITVGDFAGSTNNSYNVGGFGLSSFVSNGAITVGNTGANGNLMTVTNATLLSGATIIGSGSSSNTVTVSADGTWNMLVGNLTVGSGAATGNVLTIHGGGLLEASGLVTGTGAGNLITNFGGVFQFTTATPTITTNGNAGGSIFLSGGTIAFRNVSSGLNLTNNTDTARLGRLTYSGDNTLRLNNSTATNTVAGGYTFQTGGAFNNYNRLEMIGATNAITGTGVTIGSGGSFLASNTVATFSGVFTNHSANARLVDSAVNFANGLHVAGTLSLVNSYVKGGGAKTVSGRLEGHGTVVGDATVSGVIAPGFSPGSLTFSNDFTLTGTAEMELFSGGNLGTADKINVLGALAGGGLVQVTTNGTFVIVAGDKWDLFDWSSGAPALTFDGSAVALGAGLIWDVSQLNVDGTIGVILIPEPGPLALVVFGLVALGTIYHYRRARL